MSADRTSAPRRTARWLKAGLAIVGLLSTICFTVMIVAGVAKVRSGRGLAAHRTFWLVEDSWIGFLTFVACGFVAIAAGLVLRAIQQRREAKNWLQPDRK